MLLRAAETDKPGKQKEELKRLKGAGEQIGL